jgi:hypothetical protein
MLGKNVERRWEVDKIGSDGVKLQLWYLIESLGTYVVRKGAEWNLLWTTSNGIGGVRKFCHHRVS